MIYINFPRGRDWWTPGRVFERLLRTAERDTDLPADVLQALRSADANYGLNLERVEPGLAARIESTLRALAQAELTRLGQVAEADALDDTYKASLRELLALTQTG